MENNEKKSLPEKKDADKKVKDTSKKKVIIIGAVIAAVVIVAVVLAVVLGGSEKSPAGDDTAGDTGIETPVDNDTSDKPKDSDTESAPVSGDTSVDSTGDTTGSDPENTDPSVSDTEPSGEEPEPGIVIVPDVDDEPVEEETTTQIVVEEGKTAADWPDELPDAIPAFKGALSFNNNCSYELDDTQEVWYMAWDTNQADYDAWMSEIKGAGFNNDDTVVSFWANGEYVLDIVTEEFDGGLWVSMDVYHSFDIVYPDSIAGSVPAMETSGTLEYWYNDPAKRLIRIHYVNAPEWAAELNEYRIMLKDLGFTMGPDSATLSVNGTEFTIHWDGEYCSGKNMLAVTY